MITDKQNTEHGNGTNTLLPAVAPTHELSTDAIALDGAEGLSGSGIGATSKPKLLVSFSGGETSGYMAQWLWKHKRDEYEMIFVFANTGWENEETLQFVEKCSITFGFPVVWIEAVPRVKYLGRIVDMCNEFFGTNWLPGVGTSFKIVNFKTADRSQITFERVIQKHGIPNMNTPHCSRELKRYPIKAYVRSLGWKKYFTAIGFRIDEAHRMADEKRMMYPLIHKTMQPMTKPKINFWWGQQDFRLNLKGYEGNCEACWKKSDAKLFTIAKEKPRAFDFPAKMELRYGKYVPENRLRLMRERGEEPKLPVVFYRKNRSAIDILNESKNWNGNVVDDAKIFDWGSQKEIDFDLDDAGESCDIYGQCK